MITYRPTEKLRNPGRRSSRWTPHSGVLRKQIEPLSDSIDDPVGGSSVAALSRDVIPDGAQLRSGLRGETMYHCFIDDGRRPTALARVVLPLRPTTAWSPG